MPRPARAALLFVDFTHAVVRGRGRWRDAIPLRWSAPGPAPQLARTGIRDAPS